MHYEFKYIDECNMCGSPSGGHKVLGKRLNRRQGLWPKGKLGITTTVVQCSRCGLIYPNPLPVPARIEQHYDMAPESYWVAEALTVSDQHLRHQIGRFETLSGKAVKNNDLTALDVGAGVGLGMIALEKAGFLVCGMEPSRPFYSRAVAQMGIPEERLQLATVEEASFPDGSFDFINMAAVLEHLYDPSAVIRQAVRWLKPRGLMHIEVPSSAYLMSRLARLFYRATGSDYVVNISPMHAPYHLYEFSPLSFELHAKRNNYKVAFFEFHVCESWMPRLVKPLFNRAMALTNTGMQLAIWLRRNDSVAETSPGAAKRTANAACPVDQNRTR